VPISEFSNISLYGKGVFTTAALCNGEPFLWEKHWRRLIEHSLGIGINVSEHSEESVRDAVSKAIRVRGIRDGRVRVSLLDGSSSDLWGGNEEETLLSVLVGERSRTGEALKLTTSPNLVNSTSPLAGIKSCNYLEPLLSIQEARKRGFNEAIRRNERSEITSGCLANIFWLSGGRLYTPSLKTGCLAGTTREYILENLECEEVTAGIDELEKADEMFLTSSGIGVVQVVEFGGRELRRGVHPIMKVLPF
jgi:branched-chain amino acid aminotransferase